MLGFARDATGLSLRDDNRTKEKIRLTGGDHHGPRQDKAEDQMTRFHTTARAGPHEQRLRARLDELRVNGWGLIRLTWVHPASAHMDREERCAAILAALDALVRPVSDIGRRTAA